MAEDLNNLQQVQGRVKWFDPAKGFGFIVADGGGPDILLHVNVLRNFGQSSVADGTRIEVVTQRTQRGVQAVEVVHIEASDIGETPPLADFADLDPEVIQSKPLLPARVKWFDKAKGFGFANLFGDARDVFLHIEVIRQSGLADLQPGEAIALRVIEGRRGLMAVQVKAWEAAAQARESQSASPIRVEA